MLRRVIMVGLFAAGCSPEVPPELPPADVEASVAEARRTGELGEGGGGPECLLLLPDSFDFGTVRVGCTRQATFQLLNRCDRPVYLAAVEAFFPHAQIVMTTAFAPRVPARGAVSAEISFAPTQADVSQQAFLIRTGGVDHVLVVRGTGDPFFANEDRFRIEQPRMMFFLSAEAVPATLEVDVDGAVATDWRFDTAMNALVFERSPPVGTTVTVRYRRPCP